MLFTKAGQVGTKGLGWLPDYPDIRDYTPEHPRMAQMLSTLGVNQVETAMAEGTLLRAQRKYDLRQSFTAIEDQGQLGSCTANAAVGLLEYYEKRAYKSHIDASRLFVYKATRKLMGLEGDTGATTRATMGALVLFGAPPEKYWPYDISRFDDDPPAFCYSLAGNYQTLKYMRLDTDITRVKLLERIKAYIAMNLPSAFGFTVYSSVDQADITGRIPYPAKSDGVEGGHAVVVAGYDDDMRITNTGTDGPTTTGAFLIRNSWGTGWGEKGYGWLPYEYVLKGLTMDWWLLMAAEWIETGQFGI